MFLARKLTKGSIDRGAWPWRGWPAWRLVCAPAVVTTCLRRLPQPAAPERPW